MSARSQKYHRIHEKVHRDKLRRGLCALCGERMRDNGTVDHVVPLAKGGANIAHNLAGVCHDCNNLKGSYTLDEFKAWLAERRHLKPKWAEVRARIRKHLGIKEQETAPRGRKGDET